MKNFRNFPPKIVLVCVHILFLYLLYQSWSKNPEDLCVFCDELLPRKPSEKLKKLGQYLKTKPKVIQRYTKDNPLCLYLPVSSPWLVPSNCLLKLPLILAVLWDRRLLLSASSRVRNNPKGPGARMACPDRFWWAPLVSSFSHIFNLAKQTNVTITTAG